MKKNRESLLALIFLGLAWVVWITLFVLLILEGGR